MGIKYSKEFEQKILKLWDKGISANQISKKVGKFTTAITRVLRRNSRKIPDGKGKNHSGWKGGRGLKSGYWTVYMPNHPRTLNNGRVWEHILILEKELERYIDKSEPIHHINFDRQNNNLDNLYLCKNSSKHQEIHNSLNTIAIELIKTNIIGFENGKYVLTEIGKRLLNA